MRTFEYVAADGSTWVITFLESEGPWWTLEAQCEGGGVPLTERVDIAAPPEVMARGIGTLLGEINLRAAA
jgi:hypothetical protein